MLSIYLVVAAVVGGYFGFQSGSQTKVIKPEIIVEHVEPEYYGPNAHLKLMKVCARECSASGGVLQNYNSITGSCSCANKEGK